MTLRELREQSGKIRAEVAKALGVTVQAIARYETGQRTIAIDHVLILAELLDDTAEEIIRASINSRNGQANSRQIPQRNHKV